MCSMIEKNPYRHAANVKMSSKHQPREDTNDASSSRGKGQTKAAPVIAAADRVGRTVRLPPLTVNKKINVIRDAAAIEVLPPLRGQLSTDADGPDGVQLRARASHLVGSSLGSRRALL